MPEDKQEKKPPSRPKLQMGGSLGALPTENLLQMIGNLRLSTRLLLEDQDTKDFCILTFREGELVPDIESSKYPGLKMTLEADPKIEDKSLIGQLTTAGDDQPFWNRVLIAGLADREGLRRYLIEGIRLTLSLFTDLSGVHFELSPIPMDRLGTYPGYSVTEICTLARKPRSVPEPEIKPSTDEKPPTVTAQPKPSPTESAVTELTRSGPPTESILKKLEQVIQPEGTKPQGKKPDSKGKPSAAAEAGEASIRKKAEPTSSPPPMGNDKRQALTDLLRQMRELVPGAGAVYLMDCNTRRPVASSSTLMLDDNPDFHVISERACDNTPVQGDTRYAVKEAYLVTDNYLVGIAYVSPGYPLVAICAHNTQMGLLLTAMRRARDRAVSLIGNETAKARGRKPGDEE